jgi:hypothetical protein
LALQFLKLSRELFVEQWSMQVKVKVEVEFRIESKTRWPTPCAMPLGMRRRLLSDEQCEVL